MAQHVRMHVARNAGLHGARLQARADLARREPRAVAADEERRLPGLGQRRRAAAARPAARPAQRCPPARCAACCPCPAHAPRRPAGRSSRAPRRWPARPAPPARRCAGRCRRAVRRCRRRAPRAPGRRRCRGARPAPPNGRPTAPWAAAWPPSGARTPSTGLSATTPLRPSQRYRPRQALSASATLRGDSPPACSCAAQRRTCCGCTCASSTPAASAWRCQAQQGLFVDRQRARRQPPLDAQVRRGSARRAASRRHCAITPAAQAGARRRARPALAMSPTRARKSVPMSAL